MASPERLMGLGINAEVAKRIGFFTTTVDGGSTLQGPGNIAVRASGASINLASSFDVGDEVIVFAVTACSVVPDSGSRINLQTTASAALVTAGVTKRFFRFSNTAWIMGTSA